MVKLNLKLTPSIKNLDIISKGLISSSLLGNYKSTFKGRGLEFSNYRQYNKGDDANLIDWKASVRTHGVLVKEFVEERNLDVFFLLDASSSMLFGSGHLLKLEYAMELMASLYYIVLKSGDSAGFALFNDKIVTKAYPAQGPDKFYILKKTLTNFDLYGGKYDLSNALKFLRHYLKPRTLVIIISDFIGVHDKHWEKSLKISAREFEIVGMMVRDKHDKTLPIDSGQVVVEDPYSKQQLLIDPKLIKKDFEKHAKKQEQIVKDAFKSVKADLLSLDTEEDFIKPIMNFFNARRGRVR
jgi:uncharacterized protein (DUF58 family)